MTGRRFRISSRLRGVASAGPLALFPAIVAAAALAACAGQHPVEGMQERHPAATLPAPAPATARAEPDRAASVERGKYMVELLGCGTCHTDGALTGEPDPGRLLAGSSVGIAYSSPLDDAFPGVVFPANLTPDEATGIGGWTQGEIVRLLRSGMDRQGRSHLPVMPWPAYARLSETDARGIAAYLLALDPVSHRVPRNVRPGQRTNAPFVYFGVYQTE